MKLAILSDLHANLPALEACLADARSRGATQYAILGDVVGYGADPGPVVDIVMRLSSDGAWVLRGNHDEAALRPVPGSQRADHVGGVWTRTQLSPAQLAFLENRPLLVRDGALLFVHASAMAPEQWTYVARPLEATQSLVAAQAHGATHVFCGHVHEQRLFYAGAAQRMMAFEPTPGVELALPAHRHWLATVGSVGQPRDGRPEAMYALLDVPRLRLTFLRVPYDVAGAAAAIRRAGLPEWNARRLAMGT